MLLLVWCPELKAQQMLSDGSDLFLLSPHAFSFALMDQRSPGTPGPVDICAGKHPSAPFLSSHWTYSAPKSWNARGWSYLFCGHSDPGAVSAGRVRPFWSAGVSVCHIAQPAAETGTHGQQPGKLTAEMEPWLPPRLRAAPACGVLAVALPVLAHNGTLWPRTAPSPRCLGPAASCPRSLARAAPKLLGTFRGQNLHVCWSSQPCQPGTGEALVPEANTALLLGRTRCYYWERA